MNKITLLPTRRMCYVQAASYVQTVDIIALILTGCIAASAAECRLSKRPIRVSLTSQPISSTRNKSTLAHWSMWRPSPTAGRDGCGACHPHRQQTNVQDSVTLDASSGAVAPGEQVILAHGVAVQGHAEIGEHGVCPGGAAHCPSFA